MPVLTKPDTAPTNGPLYASDPARIMSIPQVYRFVYSFEVTNSLLHLLETRVSPTVEHSTNLIDFLQEYNCYSSECGLTRPGSSAAHNEDNPQDDNPMEANINKLPEIYDDFVAVKKLQWNSNNMYRAPSSMHQKKLDPRKERLRKKGTKNKQIVIKVDSKKMLPNEALSQKCVATVAPMKSFEIFNME
ncbi:hypothetical protein CAPTEDRAFT_198561 [Capitella teleta]|uniref:Uncharacterized protein n=1 Tax=Capitella teleta TaxID=283909 RepID=R7U4W1_CAPTE|nr:hypothetical protein CAPTEDRAFT_198561 [Capitella teleta]|eukprot:ELT98731.1 hypothetical protein CAPTEDRAFT_198561 [Capitella teleta]